MTQSQQHIAQLLDRLSESESTAAAAELQQHIFAAAYEALGSEEGPWALYELAPRFGPDGLFSGSDWDEPSQLQAGLVEHTLSTSEGVGVECCNLLRFVALALEDTHHPRLAPDEARSYLELVLALNLNSIFPVEFYPRADQSGEHRGRIKTLFEFIVKSLGADGIMTRLVAEANRILLTRPIKIEPVRRMVETAAHGLREWGRSERARDAWLLVDALQGPTPLCRAWQDPDDYGSALSSLDDPALLLEADTLANSMRRTGLVCPQHAMFVRLATQRKQRLLERALGIEDVGRCCLREFRWLLDELIAQAIFPATAQAVYGLAQLLDRGVLFQTGAASGLRDLLTATIRDDVAQNLLAGVQRGTPPDARSVLVSGALAVLGQPRGVDQGHNPTCQSARAISLWAQNDPAYLVRLITQAARDGNLRMHFEGTPLDSVDVERGVASELHAELDSISLLLTPHIDRLYVAMSQLALDRDEDEHRWVNPELHGTWVFRGFAAAIDETTGAIANLGRFVRQFYASYHPAYNGGHQLSIPQPAGVAITNSKGAFLDWHAISLQRIGVDPRGELRVYFFNPNHDKGQDWGHGVVTSTSDHGELMGESSLPFAQFAARTYVFHFEPTEVGELDSVPVDDVEDVLDMIGRSWGRSFGADAAITQERASQ